MPPGGHTPFELLVNGLRNATELNVRVEANVVDQSPRQVFRFFDLDQWQTVEAYCVKGRLRIPGEALQEYLTIAAVLYDSAGGLINFGHVYKGYPGEMASDPIEVFELCIDSPSQSVARYEVRAWGE